MRKTIMLTGYFYIIGYIFLSRVSDEKFFSLIEPSLENILKAGTFLIGYYVLNISEIAFKHVVLSAVVIVTLPIIALMSFDKVKKIFYKLLPTLAYEVKYKKFIKYFGYFIIIIIAILYLPYHISSRASFIYDKVNEKLSLHADPFYNYKIGNSKNPGNVNLKTIVPYVFFNCEKEIYKTKNNQIFKFSFPIGIKSSFIIIKENFLNIIYYTDMDQINDSEKQCKRYSEKNYALINIPSDKLNSNGFCFYSPGALLFCKEKPKPSSISLKNALITVKQEDFVSLAR